MRQDELPSETGIAIVGAGFGGLGMAIRLKQAGIDDFVVLERAADVGGTWYANSYPGCQCDVPSNLYSFSFARKADWTHSYPEQPQILDYLHDCWRRFGIDAHTWTSCEMTEATWLADEQRWRVETQLGTVTARVLVGASGVLSEPVVPVIEGLDDFRGRIFHSAAWDHSHDLRGERVGLVGTGATAIQIGPRIRPRVAKLSVFQRTPPWILRHPDHENPEWLKRLYAASPTVQRAARAGVYGLREGLVLGVAYEPRLMKFVELQARAHMRMQVRDAALRRRLTPDYTIGCKRILLSSDWYPMLQEPNCELVTSGIARLTPSGVVSGDGVEHPLDALIFATGFSPTDPPIARRLRGRAGETLSDAWQGSPQAYLGTTVAGFPNLFLLWGPNLNLAHTSIVYMLESQIHYVMEALRVMHARGVGAIEVRGEVQDAWNDEVQRRLQRTVWDTGGCASWYLDRNGRDSVMWPDFTFRFRRRVREFDASDYVLEATPALAGAVP